MDGEVSVSFEPQGKVIRVRPGVTVREAAARAGVFLDYPCGGQGTCGKCRVRIPAGTVSPPTSLELGLLVPNELKKGVRLACQATVMRTVVVTVPETSLLASTYKILIEAWGDSGAGLDPPIQKQFVQLPMPTLEDDCADFERLRRVAGPLDAETTLLRELPQRLRAWDFAGTVVAADGRLIDFEQGDTTPSCPAAAIDIGTTTLVATLLDSSTGKELARVSRINPQTSLGDDVLTRILYARQSAEGLEELRRMVIQALDAMLGELAAAAGITPENIYEVTVAGNTTMQHLFAGLDPSALGEIPFVPAMSAPWSIPAPEAGLSIHPRGRVHLAPVIGGFVGGDTVAGMLATNIAESTGPTMLIDIGTNGELVVHKEGGLWATSCAAGPAFEGARISHGMRAATGAIEEITFDADVHCNVIGEVPPVGICGSALIDAAAGLLRLGVLLPQGLLLTREQLPETLPKAIRERVVEGPNGPAFLLVDAGHTGTGNPIPVTQGDIRELQLATAAIRAGIDILLHRAELAPGDLEHVLVAGAFGNYIRCENAQRMGLLPHGVPRSRLAFVGNTSLAGACRAALSDSARKKAAALATRTRHVDLSLDPRFHEAYVGAMFFPDSEAIETLSVDRP